MEQHSSLNAVNKPRADRNSAHRRLCLDQVDAELFDCSKQFNSTIASQQSTPTKLSNSQSSDDIPIIPSAQLPLLQPGPIKFGNPEVLIRPVAKGDASMTMNRPINNANLTLLLHPWQQFYQ